MEANLYKVICKCRANYFSNFILNKTWKSELTVGL